MENAAAHRTMHEAPSVDRVNVEPAILLGLSSSEASWTIAAAFALWGPIGILVGFLVHSMAVGVVIATALPLLTVYIAAKKMASIKRDRPDLYYLHLIRHALARSGLRRTRFISHRGCWDVGRRLDMPRISRKRH